MTLDSIHRRVMYHVEAQGKAYIRWDADNWSVQTDEGLSDVVSDLQELETAFVASMAKMKPQTVQKAKKERGRIIVPGNRGSFNGTHL